MKNAILSTKNFVVAHKTPIAMVGTASAMLIVNRWLVTNYRDFINEKDLLEEFNNFLAQ